MKVPERKQNAKKYAFVKGEETQKGNPLTNYDLIKEFSFMLKEAIEDKTTLSKIDDFPEEGIKFLDIVDLIADPGLMSGIITNMDLIADSLPKVDFIVSPESRGFIFGASLAAVQGVGFIPLRKSGKLPIGFSNDNPVSYFSFRSSTEYSSEMLTISTKSIKRLHDVFMMNNDPEVLSKVYSQFEGKLLSEKNQVEFEEPFNAKYGDTVKPVTFLFVDDVLATGNTALSVKKFFDSFWVNKESNKCLASIHYPNRSSIFDDVALSKLSLPVKVKCQSVITLYDLGFKIPDEFTRFSFDSFDFPDRKSNEQVSVFSLCK